MKLGFLTACLPATDPGRTSASGRRRTASRRSRWRRGPTSATAPSPRPTSTSRGSTAAPRPTTCARCSSGIGLELSSLAYYDNNLHPDPDERAAIHAHLHRCIDAAALLGCPTVGTFVGRDPGRSVAENLRDAEEVFRPLVDHAGEAGVKLIIENCVMEGWHPDGYPGNLAYSPELWEWMFSLGLYLNYDPSHLLWMGIDPVEAVRPYVDRIPHAQAKDIELDPAARNRFGWPGRPSRGTTRGTSAGGATGCPGRGQVDWSATRRRALRGRVRRRALGRARGPGLGRHRGEGRDRAAIAHRTLRPLIVA